MEKIIPISDLQTSAKKYIDQVRETDQAVIVTQRGRAAAVLVSFDRYEGLLATKMELGFPDWKQRLARAEKESGRGKGMELDAFLKKTRRR